MTFVFHGTRLRIDENTMEKLIDGRPDLYDGENYTFTFNGEANILAMAQMLDVITLGGFEDACKYDENINIYQIYDLSLQLNQKVIEIQTGVRIFGTNYKARGNEDCFTNYYQTDFSKLPSIPDIPQRFAIKKSDKGKKAQSKSVKSSMKKMGPKKSLIKKTKSKNSTKDTKIKEKIDFYKEDIPEPPKFFELEIEYYPKIQTNLDFEDLIQNYEIEEEEELYEEESSYSNKSNSRFLERQSSVGNFTILYSSIEEDPSHNYSVDILYNTEGWFFQSRNFIKQSISVMLSNPLIINSYILTTYLAPPGFRHLKEWEVYGVDAEKEEWVLLDSQNNDLLNGPNNSAIFQIQNPIAITGFAIKATGKNHMGTYHLTLQNLWLCTTPPIEINL